MLLGSYNDPIKQTGSATIVKAPFKKSNMSNFQSLNLIQPILHALEKKGYTIPTPIQAQAIPHLLEGKDLLGIAQTGTGKTAAFALPILNNLAKNRREVKSKKMRVLILTPTRELASQIADNINTYGKGLGLKHTVIFGGVGENPQITAMQKGMDIVVATPGRLLDLTNQGFVNYDELEVFVLDEADRMLDMGFINDIKNIIRRLPKERQTLFFSATMPLSITSLANSILKDPVRIEVTPQSTTVEKIEQKVLFVEKNNKNLLLKSILENEEAKAVLVFCRMKHGANKVEDFLNSEGIKAEAIHGNKSQSARERALQNFRDGKIRVLVATDIAARGIDIPGVTHVINYDLPQEPESYVHRIGRTARAGREGIAIAFCDPMERILLKAVEKAIKRPIPVDNSHAYFGVEGVSVHRKISSGRTSGSAAGKPGAARHSSEARPTGSRIFAAKSDGARPHAARPEREHSRGGPAVREPRGERGEHSRGDRPARVEGDRPTREHSAREDRPRDDRRTPRHEGARDGARSSHSSRDGAPRKPGDRDRRPSRGPVSGPDGTAKPAHRYAKSTSKGRAFHANKRGGSHGAKKSGSGVKSGIGKLVSWFKGK